VASSPVEQAVTKPLTHNYQAAFLYSGKISLLSFPKPLGRKAGNPINNSLKKAPPL
jgi:hypothetical protein